MIRYLERFLGAMRPAFSRQATFAWFVVVFVAAVLRNDTFGVSSFVRALSLDPACYPSLIHFFHSTAWEVPTFVFWWWRWLAAQQAAYRIAGRLVLLGDHTKTPKDGRRIPAVETLHQDSETASKPSYFRGHHWGCVGLLVGGAGKFFAAPLWGEIHADLHNESRSTRIVRMALAIAQTMAWPAFLVLDAYFAVGPVFKAAAAAGGLLHIITRAKKNVVAYLPAPRPRRKRRGRPRQYGKKLKLMELFDTWAKKFQTGEAEVYQDRETVRYLTLDLLWKPVKGWLRFFLIATSRGPIILMTSDRTLDALVALELYCRRSTIERMFDALKNILGGMRYHFWSKYLSRSSRRPTKATAPKPISSAPATTHNTLAAIEKFLQIQLVVLGVLHLLACRFPRQIVRSAHCWLRTPGKEIPSEFVTRTALANTVRMNLIAFAKGLIPTIIRQLSHTARRPRKVA